MKHIDPRTFVASQAWGALDIANLNGTTVRLHWTDQPYQWHVNDGAGFLRNRTTCISKTSGVEQTTKLKPGDIFYAARRGRAFRRANRSRSHSCD